MKYQEYIENLVNNNIKLTNNLYDEALAALEEDIRQLFIDCEFVDVEEMFIKFDDYIDDSQLKLCDSYDSELADKSATILKNKLEKENPKNKFIVKVDNCSLESFIDSNQEIEDYIASNYNFIITINGEDCYFDVCPSRYSGYDSIESSDINRFNSNHDDRDMWIEYEDAIIQIAEALQEEIMKSIDDNKFYVCYTEHTNKTQGRSGYNTNKGIMTDDSGNYLCFDSEEEAEEACNKEIRWDGYHSYCFVVQGLKAALEHN